MFFLNTQEVQSSSENVPGVQQSPEGQEEYNIDIPQEDIITKFWNCRILKHHKLVQEDLYVRNGIIIDSEQLFYSEKRTPHFDVDCKGMIVAPGLIDLQINGKFNKL